MSSYEEDQEYDDEFDEELDGEEQDDDRIDERTAGLGAWGLSILIHSLALLIIATIVITQEIIEQGVVNLTVMDPPPQPEERQPERDIMPPEQTSNIEADVPVENPQITQLDLPVEEIQTEDPVEMEDKARGREEAVSSSEMASSFAHMAIGAGGGAAGMFGSRSGGGRRRAVGRFGGSRASESAVEAALRWFAIHQSPNGQWSVAGYPANCDEGGPRCEPGTAHTGASGDRAATGYALLCFLGAGYDHRHMSRWRQTVRRGLEWLVEAHDGNFNYGRNYEHPVVAMALAEAFALSGDGSLREPAQKAIDILIERQTQDGEGYGLGWDYTRPNRSRMDASVSGWAVMALKSADAAGLNVGNSLQGAERYVRQAWKAANPNHANLTPYDSSGFPYTWNAVANTTSRTNLACVGLLCGVFLGIDPNETLMQTMANYVMANNLPTGYPTNTYFMYYNTLGIFQMGGERWQTWNNTVRDMLVAAQRRDPACFDGSWDFEGTQFPGYRVGRLVSTAYVTLSLQVYYRYLPMALGGGANR